MSTGDDHPTPPPPRHDPHRPAPAGPLRGEVADLANAAWSAHVATPYDVLAQVLERPPLYLDTPGLPALQGFLRGHRLGRATAGAPPLAPGEPAFPLFTAWIGLTHGRRPAALDAGGWLDPLIEAHGPGPAGLQALAEALRTFRALPRRPVARAPLPEPARDGPSAARPRGPVERAEALVVWSLGEHDGAWLRTLPQGVDLPRLYPTVGVAQRFAQLAHGLAPDAWEAVGA